MKNWCKRASDLFFCIAFLICLSVSAFGQNMFRKVNDFDGDGKADFAVTRDIGGLKYWYIRQSTAGLRVAQWGIDTDEHASGDYDGDNKTDIGIFRKELTDSGLMHFSYWISRSQLGTLVNSVGPTNSVPQSVSLHQDYSGDGKTDIAYTFTGNNIQMSCCNGTASYIGTPVRLGDMTGDGKAELAAFTSNANGNTLTLKNTDYVTLKVQQFGVPGDQFVAADFDGDGKGDIAIFRESNGTWWWIRSSDGVVNAAQFGQAGDKPVPADYDGDGKTDLAIWRPDASQSVYWVYGSLGNLMVAPFGIGTDQVVTY